jgi:hypothetical protein
LLETLAVLHDLTTKVELGVRSHDLAVINAAVMSHTFSTRLPWNLGTKPPPNILTLLGKVDKALFKERKDGPLGKCYARLSEFVHPNWLGTVAYFGHLEKEALVDRI